MAKKILVIDDEPHVLKMIESRLIANGYDVITALTGNEGYDKAKSSNPDLILLDLMLPDISGFEVCEKLKKEPGLSNTIVVVLSVRDNLEDITKAFHAGADDYIIKPPVPGFLTRKIKLYLGER